MTRKRKFLLASVLALQNLSFIYPSCQKCFSRIILGSKRYIQDPNKIPETLDSDTTQDLLTKAVEICFVGQSFIFGVTNFENQCRYDSDSSNFLQRYHDIRREIRALVACQIILPDPRVSGFTVIDCFHQLLQTSNLRTLHCNSQESSSQLISLHHSNSDLSSIHDSDSPSYFLESHSRDNVSRFWHLPLEFTSTLSQLTDNDDVSASEKSMAISTLHQNRKCMSFAEAIGSSDCHDSIQDSGSLVSYMDKKSTTKKLGEEIGLQTNQLSVIHNSHQEIRITTSNLFPLKMQEHFESSSVESFHDAIEIKNDYSQDELPCYQHHEADNTTSHQETSTCSPASLRPEEVANSSQDFDPVVWDDLPLSESLHKFLAVVESEIVKTSRDGRDEKHNIDNDIKFHADYCTRLSVSPWKTTRTLCTPPVPLTSSQAIDKANSSKDNLFSKCEANQSPNIQKESQPDNTAEAVSISNNRTTKAISVSSNGRGVSEYSPPNTCLAALFPTSEDSETTVTVKQTIKILPNRGKISSIPSTSENDHSYLSVKYFNGGGEKPLSEVNERLTTLCSKTSNDVSGLCKLENKHHMWPKNQHGSFTICRKLIYPLETLCSSAGGSTNTSKETCGHIDNNLTQSPPGYEGSYNASADLFDDIAKETDLTTEITKKSEDVLLQWETSLAGNHLEESSFSLKSLSENSTQSSQKLPLQSTPAFGYPRTCSPLAYPQSDLEYDIEDSQDFVPCSQSTPVAGFHHTRTHGIHGTFKTLPVFYANYANLNANYKKTPISPENDKQQATPSCPQNIKIPSQKIRSPVMSNITQTEIFNHCTVAEGFETASYEWVPPTMTKVFRSDMLRFQVMGLRKYLAAHNSPGQKEVPRKKLKHIKQRTDTCFIKKFKTVFTGIGAKQKTYKCNCKRSGHISKESVFGLDSFSENCLLPVSEANSAWSPELFSLKKKKKIPEPNS
ncbi:DNA damage-induced apoptosis suppressor protein isoform X2 [Fukomys damarensis]|uniref:DNA damage-induced apoptosis suppressor protein isoform X2 n=1 Tax=Fukomys damarensis TaxID=885580 RepID=UPI00053F4E79|nr:DNA damage-induced apoptosis suppressor protein isoform X2 [Fukomys damarensis]